MKTALDPRHLKRVQQMQDLFAYDFSHIPAENESKSKENTIIVDLPKVDALIVGAAPAWPIGQINKVDLAILRISVYELLYSDTPPKVVIDEAIELAKEYGAEHSPKFVNGVLAHIAEQIRANQMHKEVKEKK